MNSYSFFDKLKKTLSINEHYLLIKENKALINVPMNWEHGWTSKTLHQAKWKKSMVKHTQHSYENLE